MSLEQPRRPEVDEYSHQESITIGEAFEATTSSNGDKPIDPRDAVAIQTAEMRATARCDRPLMALAQLLSLRPLLMLVQREMRIRSPYDVLQDASVRLRHDKAVTDEDAEVIARTAWTVKPDESTTPDGVAATMTSAARVNQNERE